MSALSEPRRPRLLARNRKLRHLKGLSLRNLTFTPPTHLRTADDAGLNRSPGKLEVLKETSQLHSSRSSDNLRTEGTRPEMLRPTRPRKASMSLMHATPTTRQKKLESLFNEAVGDVFFSLHVGADTEPVYISETREKSANFNFQFFDLGDRAIEVSRSCCVTIRVWARRPKRTSWTFLLEDTVDLRRLNFIGTLLDRRFPPNSLVFHLEDGLYSLDFPTRESGPKRGPLISTSSYNALMKLANLESSIEDALDTQQKIMAQISEILDQCPPDASEAAVEEVSMASKYVAAQQRANRLGEKRRGELRESLKSRREAISQGKELQAKAEEDMAESRERLDASRRQVEETEQQIHGQRRRICADLADVFPITPIPHAPPLSFQICGIPLPNSVYDAATAKSVNEDVLSAGLGLVTMLTRHLQFYLSRPLPYPLDAYGSRSSARDDISQLSEKQAARREFPLYLPRGGSTVGQWRFEYGWFLLNKDIEALCSSQGLKVVDIRHTLPNLKYLLYVCSAGTDEVPERKKGGVRGLWVDKMKGRGNIPSHLDTSTDGSSTTGSRRGSVDSDMMGQHEDALRNAVIKGVDGPNDLVVGSLHQRPDDGLALPFAESDTKFTLRTKGLRENVSR